MYSNLLESINVCKKRFNCIIFISNFASLLSLPFDINRNIECKRSSVILLWLDNIPKGINKLNVKKNIKTIGDKLIKCDLKKIKRKSTE